MTREEEIKKAEVEYSNKTLEDGCDYIGQYAKQEAFIAGAKWADSKPPKGTSLIKWQTGKPKEEGFYLVTFRFLNNHGKNGITKAEWYNKHWYIGLNYPQEEILAWCKLGDVEPYKEE